MSVDLDLRLHINCYRKPGWHRARDRGVAVDGCWYYTVLVTSQSNPVDQASRSTLLFMQYILPCLFLLTLLLFYHKQLYPLGSLLTAYHHHQNRYPERKGATTRMYITDVAPSHPSTAPTAQLLTTLANEV